MKANATILPVLAVCSFVLAGCNSGATCDSKCSGDAFSETEKDSCENKIAKGPCGSEYQALLVCQRDNQVCGADNKTDREKTQEALAKSCQTQSVAYVKCEAGGIADGGIADGGTGDGGS